MRVGRDIRSRPRERYFILRFVRRHKRRIFGRIVVRHGHRNEYGQIRFQNLVAAVNQFFHDHLIAVGVNAFAEGNLGDAQMVGNAGAEVQRVSFVLHITDGGPDVQQEVTRKIMQEHLDAVIPLECVEWTAASYVRDAAQLGRNIVMLLPGHMAGEALGNRWAVTWLRRLTEGKVPVRFIQMDELFQYI